MKKRKTHRRSTFVTSLANLVKFLDFSHSLKKKFNCFIQLSQGYWFRFQNYQFLLTYHLSMIYKTGLNYSGDKASRREGEGKGLFT